MVCWDKAVRASPAAQPPKSITSKAVQNAVADCIQQASGGAIKPDQTGEYGKASDGALFWMGSQPFLKVNLNGERFMNEYMPYDLVLHLSLIHI